MPLNFGQSILPAERERIIATFDFLDIATGFAVQSWYGGTYQVAATVTKFLSPTTFYTSRGSTQTGAGGTGDHLQITSKFDDVILEPFTTGTEVLITAPMQVQQGGPASDFTVDTRLSGGIIKIATDGVTETVLSSDSIGDTLTSSGASGNTKQQIVTIKATIPETKFKKGETLRLQIENWGKWNGPTGAGRTGDVGVGHSPLNEDSTGVSDPITWTVTSICRAQIPIKIQL